MTKSNPYTGVKSKLDMLASYLATGGGIGNLPLAPGTWASMVAVLVAVFLHLLGGPWLLSFSIIIIFLVGTWASNKHSLSIKQKDPSSVIIDEFCGQWLAILPIAMDWRYYVVAFIIFRIADIFKPWPCKNAERIPGGMGIMLDDVCAGVYAGVLTLMIATWLGTEQTLPFLSTLLE
jgi:phosphatidylglycerophosphatase A